MTWPQPKRPARQRAFWFSARAVACGAHKDRGFNDGAAWMARQVGGTTGQARQALETAAGLADCHDTRSALLDGELSLSQAAEIVKTEFETPGAEAELLEIARSSDLGSAARQGPRAPPGKHRCQRPPSPAVASTALPPLARPARAWSASRELFLPRPVCPSSTASSWQRIAHDAHVQQSGGERERFEAYAADALAAMAVGEGPARSPRPDLVIVCDLFAWRRGHTHSGEVCQVIGGGPVPVELAHDLGKDAFLKAVLHDGVAVHTIKHFGRHFPAELRTALDLGPVPAFTGAQCGDCGSRFGLEYDHINPVANKGPTSYGNVQALCWDDHKAKTERDRQAGLLGPSPPYPPYPPYPP